MELFGSRENGVVTAEKLYETFRRLQVAECEVLYVHTALNFGTPLVRRSNLLQSIAEVFLSLGVSTLIFPTFTFSFCTPEKFDVEMSASRMGAINEYVRTMPGTVRTIDPMLSHVVWGRTDSFAFDLSSSSLGSGSFYERLDKAGVVNFLFLGVHPGKAFTYMHHLERVANVDYRYDRVFTGEIVDSETSRTHSQRLFVRYDDVVPNGASYAWAEDLVGRRKMRKEILGDSQIWLITLQEARHEFLETLEMAPHYFVDLVELRSQNRKSFTLGKRNSL